MTMIAALTSCTLLGLQHGFDWDHVAAITDVASVQPTPREATHCGFLYAVGHATTVGLLGVAVITLRHSFSGAFSIWMQRIVGLTLILLGAYVFSRLFSRQGPVSRGQAILALVDHLHNHKAGRHSEDRRYGRKSCLSLGVLHGFGAETPTQISVLVIAMNLGGLAGGFIGLGVFSAAMLTSNMLLTTAATSVFAMSKLKPVVFRWIGAITAGYSAWIGILLMTS